jgi:hypothetical protein
MIAPASASRALSTGIAGPRLPAAGCEPVPVRHPRCMRTPFIPGLELARQFHAEVVGPLVGRSFPELRYSAALIGWGSDVLGFDSPRSTDHNWGPRLQIFLAPGDASRAGEISALLARRLPAVFRGWPTAFPDVTEASDERRHWVEVTELGPWLDGQLGFDPRHGVTLLDWLATPAQRLAEVTAGAVFHDRLDAAGQPGYDERAGPAGAEGSDPARRREPGGYDKTGGRGRGGPGGGLAAVRSRLAWYPRDVWCYVLACQWARISQEDAFPGRCAEAGDELGSAIVAARLARDLMRLCLLMQRRYPPYSKWLGGAFARCPAAGPLVPLLSGAVSAAAWPERERNLCGAYQAAARMHNELGITAPVDVTTRQFHNRPYQVLGAERLVTSLQAAIDDPEIRRLPLTGAIDQFVDSTDVLGNMRLVRAAVAAALSHGAAAAR